MALRIRFLDVEHEMIDQWDETLQRRPTGETARFDARVQFVRFRGFKKRDAEVRLKQRFAAGNRHAAAGCFVERLVFQDFFNDFFDGHCLADHLQRFRIAGFDTFAAKHTGRTIYDMFTFFVQLMRIVFAGLQASTATNASHRRERQLRLAAFRLRIVAYV